jgi:hypothetical protein
MSEIIKFIPKAESDRARHVRESRAIYDSIFPPADPVIEQPDKTPATHKGRELGTDRSDRMLPS